MLATRSYVLHALVAAVAVGAVCSLLSVLVVLKRMAFIGQGISHAGFGGVGTAALLGYTGAAYYWQHDLIVFAFCLGTAVLIGAMTRRKRVEADTAIGILLAATMAWGVLAQNLRVELQAWVPYREWVGAVGYSPPWEAILFGSMLNVGREGMIAALVMAFVVIAAGFITWRHLLFFAFDETVCRVFGVRSKFMHYLVLVLVALVVVVSIRLVGLVLVSALLIVPGATALMLSQRTFPVLLLSLTVGILGAAGGLMLSLEIGALSPGACVVAVLSLLFGLGWLYQYLIQRRASRAVLSSSSP
ncbi:MAG: metal ABC transporter permease [Phycisphaeraceae bacterium]